MEISLANLKQGDSAKLIDIAQNPSLHFKLLSLGLLPGDTIKVISCAPFGGPISVRHGGGNAFAIRKSEAKNIIVEILEVEKN